ncbi:hypothetical protein B0A53_06088 [Rhodotorula sp. CCFEE 5036]|nr:hypothetical protein B0A53_06088 [Rhodotorula sp. CCFEE 5036]
MTCLSTATVHCLAAASRSSAAKSSRGQDIEDPSVRRVLRETEESQDERAAWSDSAVRGVADRLNARLAERDRKRDRQRAAALRRREEAKRRAATALASGSDDEADAMPHLLFRFRDVKSPFAPPVTPHPGRTVPEPSPPVPTSFQPFTWHARSQSQPHRSSSQGHALSRKDVTGSLKRLARRGSSAVRSSASRSSLASTDQTRHVLGQPIRHLCRSASTDSFVHLDTTPDSSTSTLDIRAGGSTEHAGEAVTAPLTVGHSGRKPFLRLSLHGDGTSRQDDRDCTSPASFIEFSDDDDPCGPNLSPIADRATEMSPPAPPQTGGERTAQRPHHLSINSTVFLNPLQPPASPYFTSEASRDSTLNAKLDDFPAPPSMAASPSSGAGECFDEFGQSRSPRSRQEGVNTDGVGAVIGGETEPARGGIGEERPPSSESAWFGDSSDSDLF